ncbi:hypothetical protein M9Y10_030014 [Tritrichomonas musculus]|uniref:Protein kinase domain-containing protein n=1 Tax=Tritrichomonas musculus TaxID=1915356 RepID=A0ABR2KQT6_9EUKA
MIQKIYRNVNDSRLIVIDQSSRLNKETNTQNYIVCFEQSLIILQQSTASIKFLQSILSNNPNLPVCFLSNTKILIDKMIEFKNREINSIPIKIMYNNFINNISWLKINMSNYDVSKINDMWSSVSSSISHYLIKKSYLMGNKYRISQFINDIESTSTLNDLNQDEFIELSEVGKGGSFLCTLYYHITSGKLCVIKKLHGNNNEADKLIQREADNYSNIRHPFLPNFYGTVKNKNGKYIVIEFINGKTLYDIEENELNYNDRIKIIFELMIIFKYFHDNGYIYRDLKPDNVMIDDNKNIVLIDLDRLIKNDDDYERTLDLGSDFSAPEVYQAGQFSYASDICSLGKMMEYLMSQATKSDEISKIEGIYTKCLNECPSNRPSISEIIDEFNSIFQTKMQIEHLFANFKEHFNNFELISVIISLIHLDQNYAEAQFGLGLIYYEDQYVTLKRDMSEAIHYYKEASSFNNKYAKNNLGIIYGYGYDNVEGQAGNAIVYFEEAIRQKGDCLSMYNLAHIHIYDEKIQGDLDKAIGLLIRSSEKFYHSTILLSLVLVKKFCFNINTINREIKNITGITDVLIYQVCLNINEYEMLNRNNFEILYETYKKEYFLYDIKLRAISASYFEEMRKEKTKPKYPNAKDITSMFYEGFGLDI